MVARFLPTSLLVFCCCIPTTLRAADTPADAAKLAAVFGAADAWKLTPPQANVGPAGGIVSTTAQLLAIESTAPVNAPTELTASFRLKAPERSSTYLTVQLACGETPDKKPKSLSFSVSSASAAAYVGYSVTAQGGEVPKPMSGYLYFQAITERSLAWPEEIRRTVEAQIAATPKIDESTITIRCTAEKGRFRGWINGRYAGEQILPADYDPSGLIRLQVAYGAELISLHVQPLTPVAARFEPLAIAGFVNSATLNGANIASAELTKLAATNGVPFQFVTPATPTGNDHIDLSPSWTRFGALPGYIASNFGLFGGRWIAADRMDPARFAMYVPKGRYKALHLIAVSDDRADHVPIVTAQFYRPNAGHPFNFTGSVPTVTGQPAADAKPLPIRLANGKEGKLYHVTIPLDEDAFSWFTDLDRIGLELTKEAKYYRGYPDPLEFSWHGGGLPSSVQIYAATLERSPVDVEIIPENFGHVWTAPAAPKYTVNLQNATGAALPAKLTITTRSYDGKDTTKQEQQVTLPADGAATSVPITLQPKRFGLQEVTVTLDSSDVQATRSTTFRRNFAYLHEDTRERGGWEMGRGPAFGYWAWGGGHDTPKSEHEIRVMGAAGAETCTANYAASSPEIQALAEKHHFISEAAFSGGIMYYNGFYQWYTGAPKYDPAKPEETAAGLIEVMKKYECKPSAISNPTFVPFFAEPHMGNITTGVWPSHYGVDYKLTEAEQKVFDDMRTKYLIGARAIRKQWPKYKLLLPYGDPMNAVIFLKLSPESRELIDGCALDLPGFERLPEQQINQVVLNRMYPILKDLKEYLPNPYFVMIEGPCVSSADFDTRQEGQADICTRNFLNLMAYGVYLFESANAPFDCANYWGENHYGGGWLSRLPLAMPKLAYANFATISRHLNRANYVKYVTTGSTSTYCQQYKHYKSGKLVHVLWTIRGKRPVNIKVPTGTTLELFDQNDNVTTLKESGGIISFTIDQSPQYLEGLTADPQITLGESDHRDSLPSSQSRKLANLGDGSWKIVAEADEEYTKNKPLQIERFLGNMTAQSVAAPKEQGEKALAVHLEKQEKDRGVMPFYTTIKPAKPLTIPGLASELGLWIHAASDWGRIIYCVRDAKGEKWISVGTKEDWNNDDIHGWSNFCFDGWRYVTFQLPGNAPYDSYRLHGSSWWGNYGGDGIVDLPLQLDKVIIERRPKAIYGNDLVDVKPDDVLLGDLYAQYVSASDRTDETVRQSRLRMPIPKEGPGLVNPITEMTTTGVGAPTKIQRVADPTYQYDGTRCHVHFDPVAGAKTYDVWVSPYPDGRGALQLAKGWTESGGLIQGLRPDTEFYAFVVYTDANDKLSKPSDPLKFTLKDRFGYK